MEIKEMNDENGNIKICAVLPEIERRRISMSKVLNDVIDERIRQDAKWGEQNHPCLDLALINRDPHRMCEEYEIPSERRAKTMCDRAFERKKGTYAHIAIEEMSEVVSAFDPIKRREELVQLTAVCVAWIEKIDRDLNKVK